MFSIFIKNIFAVIYCTRLKCTFGIRSFIASGGTFVANNLAWVCDKPCYLGSSTISILRVKING
jgi:hypothetical protein